jgi:hypothetical protein
MEAEFSDELWKARAEYQRELFRIFDSRLTNFDNQVGVLIAAAVAVAGFGGGAAKNREAPALLLAVVVVAAGVTTALALNARREQPKLHLRQLHGQMHGQMMEKAKDAERAVGKVYPDTQEQFTSTEEVYRAVFTAWWAQSESMEARKKLKHKFYRLAVSGLFVELIFVVILLAV